MLSLTRDFCAAQLLPHGHLAAFLADCCPSLEGHGCAENDMPFFWVALVCMPILSIKPEEEERKVLRLRSTLRHVIYTYPSDLDGHMNNTGRVSLRSPSKRRVPQCLHMLCIDYCKPSLNVLHIPVARETTTQSMKSDSLPPFQYRCCSGGGLSPNLDDLSISLIP